MISDLLPEVHDLMVDMLGLTLQLSQSNPGPHGHEGEVEAVKPSTQASYMPHLRHD